MGEVQDQAAARVAIRRVRKRSEKSTEELELAIVAARFAGLSLRDVAEVAGMTPEGVRQLVERRAR